MKFYTDKNMYHEVNGRQENRTFCNDLVSIRINELLARDRSETSILKNANGSIAGQEDIFSGQLLLSVKSYCGQCCREVVDVHLVTEHLQACGVKVIKFSKYMLRANVFYSLLTFY